jgi:hypothetical protein
VELVGTGGDVVGAVRRALARGGMEERTRRDFVARHAWEGRYDGILSLALAP